MIPYPLHVALLLGACYAIYRLLLQHETYFRFHRWILLGGVCLAFGLPLLKVPASLSLRTIATNFTENEIPEPAYAPPSEVESDAMDSELPMAPVVDVNSDKPNVTPSPQAEEHTEHSEIISTAPTPQPVPAPYVQSKSPKQIILEFIPYLYITGILIFLLNFLIQLIALGIKIISLPKIKDGKFYLVELKGDEAPYSFWNFIFINPEKYDWEVYSKILHHEKIHAEQKHSFDMMLAELLVIVQWFNPFAWWYNRAIRDNLEFLTDQTLLQDGADKKQYQWSLLQVSAPQHSLSFTSNYNQSTLKKRISMMNTKKSSLQAAWKYLSLVAILFFSVISLNAVRPELNLDSQLAMLEMEDLPLEELFQTENQLAAEDTNDPKKKKKKRVKNKKPVKVKVKPINKVKVKTKVKTKTKNKIAKFKTKSAYNYSSDPTSGSWYAEVEKGMVCIEFRSSKESRRHRWHMEECLAKSAFSPNLNQKATAFKLTREAGTIEFTGNFDGETGKGDYQFTGNEQFRNFLSQEGYRDLEPELFFHLALADFGKDYVSFLKKNNIKTDSDDLIALAVHRIDKSTLQNSMLAFQKIGYRKMDVDDFIAMHIHDVNPEYVQALKDAGVKNLDWDEVVAARIHNVTPEYIKSMYDAGFKDMDIDELVGFAIHDVDAEYIKTFKAMGFRNFDADEIVAAKIHGVTPEYIKSLENSGLGDMDIDEVVGFAIHNVDAEYIKTFKAMGFRNFDADEIVAAKIHGVTPEFVKSLEGAGLGDMDIEELTGFAIHNVDAAYIKTFKDMGFRNFDADEIVAAKIHGVTPEFVKGLQASGLGDMDIDELTGFAIHNVDAEYIKTFKTMGFRDFDADEIVAAKIHGVTPEYVKGLQASGLGDMDIDDITAFKIHNVQPAFIASFRETGLDFDDDEIMAAKIHNVTPKFAKEVMALGFKNVDMDDIIGLRIHNVTPEFIKKKRAEGFESDDLDDYIDLKHRWGKKGIKGKQ